MTTGRLGVETSRLHRLATVGSQFLNVLVLNGHPDETISGRAWRQGVLEHDPSWIRARLIIDRMFFFDPDHCRKSHHADREFADWINRYG